MFKYRTLNNELVRDIFLSVKQGHAREVYMCIYGRHHEMTPELLSRIFNMLYSLAPMTIHVYKELPYVVQSFYNSLWLNSLKK